jgi:uncharacterized membrane protein YfcA
MRSLWLWFGVAAAAAGVWIWTVVTHGIDVYSVITSWWPASVTMVLGAFVAGASAEGGGAIAYPIFTLLLKIPPDAARNFSLMIQSVGMVSASALIIGKGIRIEPRGVILPSIGGIPGFAIGTAFIAPYLEPVHTKLFFVSLWLAFGIGLWRVNRNRNRLVTDQLPAALGRNDFAVLLTAGLVGGMITAVVGNGIDMLSFCVLTLWYGVNERVATPTSVVLMSVLTLVGTATRAFVTADIGSIELHAWIAAAPVVLFVAPLGAWMASKLQRLHIAYLLQAIILLQFIGALYVLSPTIPHILFCATVLVVGTIVMIKIDRTG